MHSNSEKKIIELESKFSRLITKYNELKKTNKELKDELIDLEIESIIKNYKFKNQKLTVGTDDNNNEIKREIDDTIKTIDNLIENFKN
ncbi:MAG: hypothetical protein ACJZZ7_06275 [Cytophagales bacterium]|nr:hypothetical protein [Marinoscillum sp.]OUX26642.1 MAG: hypothetical protein CBE22_02490 [Flammeovirgaceae bacterium TMED262]PDH44973.1 MAG: hypothetical protein CNE34_03065 [Rhodothermaeota bacterium MED-G18]|tara:strand:+ start:1368 stop:1631 length:264 start_codon:yes stop_codon:yes gene_type:complete